MRTLTQSLSLFDSPTQPITAFSTPCANVLTCATEYLEIKQSSYSDTLNNSCLVGRRHAIWFSFDMTDQNVFIKCKLPAGGSEKLWIDWYETVLITTWCTEKWTHTYYMHKYIPYMNCLAVDWLLSRIRTGVAWFARTSILSKFFQMSQTSLQFSLVVLNEV